MYRNESLWRPFDGILSRRMPNEFYRQDEQRADRVNALFARIASRYDLVNDLQSLGLHRVWKQRVVRLARIKPGEPALDVCCGTGDLAIGLARAGANVTALDFTPAMLDVARKRTGDLPVSYVAGDAQQLPFADNSFAVITVGYGLRNLASWETGLREMLRVARPGGRILVLEFGKPGARIWRAAYFAYLKLVTPLVGRIFAGNAAAYAYILESVKHYPGQRGVESKMRELGMTNIQTTNILAGTMSINYAEKPGIAVDSNDRM